jgi:hypothetical protein
MRQERWGLVFSGTLQELLSCWNVALRVLSSKITPSYALLCPANEREYWSRAGIPARVLTQLYHLEGRRWDGVVIARPATETMLKSHAWPAVAECGGWIYVIEPLHGGHAA